MNKKIKSRKLFAFLVWILFGAIIVWKSGPIDIFIPWFGIITSIYIGGQAAVDAVERYTDSKK